MNESKYGITRSAGLEVGAARKDTLNLLRFPVIFLHLKGITKN